MAFTPNSSRYINFDFLTKAEEIIPNKPYSAVKLGKIIRWASTQINKIAVQPSTNESIETILITMGWDDGFTAAEKNAIQLATAKLSRYYLENPGNEANIPESVLSILRSANLLVSTSGGGIKRIYADIDNSKLRTDDYVNTFIKDSNNVNGIRLKLVGPDAKDYTYKDGLVSRSFLDHYSLNNQFIYESPTSLTKHGVVNFGTGFKAFSSVYLNCKLEYINDYQTEVIGLYDVFEEIIRNIGKIEATDPERAKNGSGIVMTFGFENVTLLYYVSGNYNNTVEGTTIRNFKPQFYFPSATGADSGFTAFKAAFDNEDYILNNVVVFPELYSSTLQDPKPGSSYNARVQLKADNTAKKMIFEMPTTAASNGILRFANATTATQDPDPDHQTWLLNNYLIIELRFYFRA